MAITENRLKTVNMTEMTKTDFIKADDTSKDTGSNNNSINTSTPTGRSIAKSPGVKAAGGGNNKAISINGNKVITKSDMLNSVKKGFFKLSNFSKPLSNITSAVEQKLGMYDIKQDDCSPKLPKNLKDINTKSDNTRDLNKPKLDKDCAKPNLKIDSLGIDLNDINTEATTFLEDALDTSKLIDADKISSSVEGAVGIVNTFLPGTLSVTSGDVLNKFIKSVNPKGLVGVVKSAIYDELNSCDSKVGKSGTKSGGLLSSLVAEVAFDKAKCLTPVEMLEMSVNFINTGNIDNRVVTLALSKSILTDNDIDKMTVLRRVQNNEKDDNEKLYTKASIGETKHGLYKSISRVKNDKTTSPTIRQERNKDILDGIDPNWKKDSESYGTLKNNDYLKESSLSALASKDKYDGEISDTVTTDTGDIDLILVATNNNRSSLSALKGVNNKEYVNNLLLSRKLVREPINPLDSFKNSYNAKVI